MRIQQKKRRPGPKCRVCSKESRDLIDKFLKKGTPMRRIAAQFDASEAGVRRHRKSCLSTPAVEDVKGENTGSCKPGRTCSICAHPKVGSIPRMILEGLSIRDIAKQIAG